MDYTHYSITIVFPSPASVKNKGMHWYMYVCSCSVREILLTSCLDEQRLSVYFVCESCILHESSSVILKIDLT
jgi:hypothetical protein